MSTRAVIYLTHLPGVGDIPGEVQEAKCRAWAAAEGIEVRAVFSDVGPVGERPGFDQMLQAVREDPVDAVIALAPGCLAPTERDQIRLGMLPVDVLYPPPERTGRNWFVAPAVLAAVTVGLLSAAAVGSNAGMPAGVATTVGLLLGGAPIAGYVWAHTRGRLSWQARDRLVTALLLWTVVTSVVVISYLVTMPGLFPVPVAVLLAGVPLITLVCTLRALPPAAP